MLGALGYATEVLVYSLQEGGEFCGRPPAEEMVIHLSAFCLIRLHFLGPLVEKEGSNLTA